MGDTSLHYTQELSVTLSLLIFSSYSTHIQKIPSFFIKLTLLQIFPYIFGLRGQVRHFWWHLSFFNFLLRCLISAERHLSKISFSYFYSPWLPQTFGTIKKLGVSPSFTLAVKSTVKDIIFRTFDLRYVRRNQQVSQVLSMYDIQPFTKKEFVTS